MIVCVCNNVSEGKIRQAVRDGATSMAELRNNLGVATTCGKCHSCAKRVLKESLHQGDSHHQHHPIQAIQVITFQRDIMPA
ncbi:MAG: (2Fe-2S)-binding protein [Herbaspirillum sp.]|nr:(2Fe-2S)-binding protein [Herbaspirillum sp.]